MDDKVQVRPELVRPNQVVNPMRGLRRRSEMEMKSSFIQLYVDASTRSIWLFSDLNVFESRERLLGFVTGIRREGKRNFRKNGHAQDAVHSIVD